MPLDMAVQRFEAPGQSVGQPGAPELESPEGTADADGPSPIEQSPGGTAESGDPVAEPATSVPPSVAAPAAAPGCPPGLHFSAGLGVARFKAPAKLAITTTPGPGGPVSAIEMHSPQFVMSAVASARGPHKELQDWEFGFTQTQTLHQRDFCFLHQHETKDVLANYGGALIDSLSAGDVPFARSSDSKPTGLLRTMFFQDQPARKIPFDVGGAAGGDCLQSASIDWGFSARLIARKRGTGAQPICPLFFADWTANVSIAPGLAPGSTGNCGSSIGGAGITSSSSVVAKGKGSGTGPFETTTKGGVMANSAPEANMLDLVPGPC